ncbi:ornithine carbamoyltransferase [Alkalimonas delamerensis]|uniref:Ornithine carbamoyltransferase n=1 Tax=Alkalimonas delamerensis TaxID=265981 RepID=A0ABT9GLM0_9GAMM|nr:ornithine carbamoyltransferase [Alkalimonas delamerensis]MDP4527870.1 ornithine carbamoyltransferase [Alkalimonas delamerensis]
MTSMHQLLSLQELNPEQLQQLLQLALQVKQQPAAYQQALAGKSIAMLFEKPSLRTRVSFDVGIQKLGGHSVYLDQQNGDLGGRETVEDFGRNLACWTDAIVARVYRQSTLEKLAASSGIPVINALSDLYHPCQALADLLTLQETFGDLRKVQLAFVGDGNNVCHSLMLGAALAGMSLVVITPPNHGPDGHVLQQAQLLAAKTGAKLTLSHHLSEAHGSQAIYTDTWVSMGDSMDAAEQQQRFGAYQLSSEVLARLDIGYLMHCLPAHRGQEVTSELLDSQASLVLQQAENRMHAQNAVLIQLLA